MPLSPEVLAEVIKRLMRERREAQRLARTQMCTLKCLVKAAGGEIIVNPLDILTMTEDTELVMWENHVTGDVHFKVLPRPPAGSEASLRTTSPNGDD